jgi:predicted nucleic acid-binding Zn ribbon protein
VGLRPHQGHTVFLGALAALPCPPGFGEGNAHAKIGNHLEPDGRRCTGCCRWLSLEEFPANHRMHLGVSSRCRECHREAVRDWRRRNRDRENADRRAAYRAAHPRVERPCVVCGRLFAKRADALVCGPRCREQRTKAQRRERGRLATAPLAMVTQASAAENTA